MEVLKSLGLRCRTLAMSVLPVSWRFAWIYRNRWWGGPGLESASGLGSTIENTTNVRRELPILLNELHCRKVLDLGCGDFNWMRHIEPGVDYLGADIVPSVVCENRANYSNDRVEFVVLDGIRDPIPDDVDVIFCREVLFHLSFRHALSLVDNVCRSNAIFFIATQIETGQPNIDVHTGGFRRLDLMSSPFYFPPPVRVVLDDAISGSRVLAVWRIEDLVRARDCERAP